MTYLELAIIPDFYYYTFWSLRLSPSTLLTTRDKIKLNDDPNAPLVSPHNVVLNLQKKLGAKLGCRAAQRQCFRCAHVMQLNLQLQIGGRRANGEQLHAGGILRIAHHALWVITLVATSSGWDRGTVPHVLIAAGSSPACHLSSHSQLHSFIVDSHIAVIHRKRPCIDTGTCKNDHAQCGARPKARRATSHGALLCLPTHSFRSGEHKPYILGLVAEYLQSSRAVRPA